MATRLQTRVRASVLGRVFSTRTDKELHALIASLCVLFEDLKIEVAGQSAKELAGLDDCGRISRQLYFIRRSFATLYEFGMTLDEIDRLPAFQPIKAGFGGLQRKHWSSAMKYFRKHNNYIARLRNNTGGHFGGNSARLAIEQLSGGAMGKIEVVQTDLGYHANLHFTKEIVANGMLRHVPGANVPAKARRLMRHAIVAYRKAVWAVNCITADYLWNRFGG